MDIEVIKTCPFGSTCEEVQHGKIYRCWLYLEMSDRNEDTGEKVPGTEYRMCALAADSIQLSELRKGTRGVQTAVENRMNALLGLAVESRNRIGKDSKEKLDHGN